jgi:nucleotide-binding universal stress UspA family protein
VEDEMNRIVVGIDGSAESREALHWAFAEAKLRGAALRVVHTWHFPVTAGGLGLAPTIDTQVIEELRLGAEALMERELAALGDEAVGVDVERAIVEGAAAPALIDAAEGSDLLVVGSRGRGGFSGLLLGSVSQQCSHHARCPVVIVRARAD